MCQGALRLQFRGISVSMGLKPHAFTQKEASYGPDLLILSAEKRYPTGSGLHSLRLSPLLRRTVCGLPPHHRAQPLYRPPHRPPRLSGCPQQNAPRPHEGAGPLQGAGHTSAGASAPGAGSPAGGPHRGGGPCTAGGIPSGGRSRPVGGWGRSGAAPAPSSVPAMP